MRSFIIHRAVWAFTFTMGVTLQFIVTADRPGPYAPKTIRTKLDSPDSGEPPVQSVTVPTVLISDYEPGSFDPSGDYHPANPGGPESEKFTHFDLEVGRRRGKLVARGGVRNAGTHYKFASVSVTEENLKFTTVSVSGVRYSFDGKFLGRGDFPSQFTGRGIVMLEGTLKRLEHGEKAAETTSPFLYYPGC